MEAPPRRRRSGALRALIDGLVVALLAGYYGWVVPRHLAGPELGRVASDFLVYYDAAEAVAVGRADEGLYREQAGAPRPLVWNPTGYFYPPAFAVALSPLTRLPVHAAVVLWHALAELALIGALACLMALGRGRVEPWRLARWLALTLVQPIAYKALAIGQLDPFLLLCTAGAALAAARRRDVACGLLVGLAAASKLYPALLIGYLALARRPRAVAAALALLAASTLGSVAVVGLRPHVVYITRVLPLLAEASVKVDNVSPYAVAAQLGLRFGLLDPARAPPLGPRLAHAAVALGLAVLVAWSVRGAARHGERQVAVAMGVGLTAAILASRLCWSIYLVELLLPGLLLWEWVPALRPRLWLLFDVVLLSGALVVGDVATPWSSAALLGGAGGMLWLSARALRREPGLLGPAPLRRAAPAP